MRFVPFALAACLIVAIVLSVVWGKPDPPLRLAFTSALPEEQIDACLRVDNFLDRHGLSIALGSSRREPFKSQTFLSRDSSTILSIIAGLRATRVTYRSAENPSTQDREALMRCTR